MDTIAAISTAQGAGGIGVIRISGKQAIQIADAVFRPISGKALIEQKGYTAAFGHIYGGNEKIDEGIALVFRAPHSYTGEDVVELSCHGGIYLTKRVLRAVFQAGAIPAQAGEFTKRAFLNGRIDLSQAEAVIDVIQSKNEYALKSSVRQLSGKLSEKIKGLRELVLNNVAYIEAALDDPEHISLDNYVNKLSIDVDKCVDK